MSPKSALDILRNFVKTNLPSNARNTGVRALLTLNKVRRAPADQSLERKRVATFALRLAVLADDDSRDFALMAKYALLDGADPNAPAFRGSGNSQPMIVYVAMKKKPYLFAEFLKSPYLKVSGRGLDSLVEIMLFARKKSANGVWTALWDRLITKVIEKGAKLPTKKRKRASG